MVAEDVAKILLDIHAVTLNTQKPFTYTSGILSPVYTDCRLLMGYPKERKEVIKLLIDAIVSIKEHFDVISGTATAGIPYAAWIADRLNLPMVYVRGKPKDHGKGNQLEGLIKKDQIVAVIEDLVTTGESSVQAVKTVRDAGGVASHIFCIITYGTKKSQENLSVNKVNLMSLTTFETVVMVAEKQGYIKKEEQAVILDWISDPSGWGKRREFT